MVRSCLELIEVWLGEDLDAYRCQALEIHEDLVQVLTEAKLHLEVGDPEAALKVLDDALTRSKAAVADLLGEEANQIGMSAGELARTSAGG